MLRKVIRIKVRKGLRKTFSSNSTYSVNLKFGMKDQLEK